MSKRFEYFGKYILLEKLATGGMAEVFLARKPGAVGIAKFLAIKRILPQYADSEEFIDMFKDEAKIAINLSHSNIVSIHEFGVENDQFFLVMDYVEGRNLRQILNKMKKNASKFSIDQIVYMIKEVAAGLDHAHRCLDGTTGKPLNITHRDMSPQNVMVSFDDGEVKIVDFGIAKAESQMETTRAGTLKGKFGYMSPEQAEGQTVDLRTDIFSLGTVLWELLANDRLFIANNEINTLRKIRDCQVPSLRKVNPNIPAELERITNKALARDRNLRYQTAAALHRDLNRFLNRQFPDFSPHDFAVFIKTLFADEILQTRKRLIEYAKIPFQESGEVSSEAFTPPPPPSSSISGDDTSSYVVQKKEKTGTNPLATETFSASDIEFNKDSAIHVKTFDQNRQPAKVENQKAENTDTNYTILDAGKVDSALKNKIDVAITENRYSLETMDDSPSGVHSYTSPNISKYTASRYQARRPDKRKTIGAFSVIMSLLIALVGYTFAIKFFPKQLSSVISLTDPILKPVHEFIGVSESSLAVRSPEDPKAPMENSDREQGTVSAVESSPSPPELKPVLPEWKEVIVSSSPSGAEIFIDGKNTGFITPSRVKVPGQRSFSMTLRRSGYIEYHKDGLTIQNIGSKIEATLQNAVVGFLDIDVKPPRQAKVFINGRLIEGERLPITRYAVPANTKLSIKAVDPVTNISDQAYIELKRNQRLKVILDLNAKQNRRPSQNYQR